MHCDGCAYTISGDGVYFSWVHVKVCSKHPGCVGKSGGSTGRETRPKNPPACWHFHVLLPASWRPLTPGHALDLGDSGLSCQGDHLGIAATEGPGCAVQQSPPRAWICRPGSRCGTRRHGPAGWAGLLCARRTAGLSGARQECPEHELGTVGPEAADPPRPGTGGWEKVGDTQGPRLKATAQPGTWGCPRVLRLHWEGAGQPGTPSKGLSSA